MNVDRTMETRAVVTPNCAIASRNQISSYSIPQNPETKKNTKYQNIARPNLCSIRELAEIIARQPRWYGVFHATPALW